MYVHEAGLRKVASEGWVNDDNGLELSAVFFRSGADIVFRWLKKSSYNFPGCGGQQEADAQRWHALAHACKWWGRAFEAHHECTTSCKHAWLAFNNFGLPLNLIIISVLCT